MQFPNNLSEIPLITEEYQNLLDKVASQPVSAAEAPLIETLLAESKYAFEQKYKADLNFSANGIKCGSKASRTVTFHVTASTNKLTPAGFVLDNYTVGKVISSMEDNITSASCEQIAEWIAVSILTSGQNWDLDFLEVRTQSDNEADIRFRWKSGYGFMPLPSIFAEKESILCPRCSSSMKLRQGPKGKFHGCSKYPFCTGTRKWTSPAETQQSAVYSEHKFVGCG